jgi:hypothetical protein
MMAREFEETPGAVNARGDARGGFAVDGLLKGSEGGGQVDDGGGSM